MKRNCFPLALALLMAFGMTLSACQNNAETKSSQESQSSQETPSSQASSSNQEISSSESSQSVEESTASSESTPLPAFDISFALEDDAWLDGVS